MSSKRKNGEGDSSARERKKVKINDARTIPVQQVPSMSTVTLKPVPVLDSMKGLPGAIDVVKFAESRAFEINAMDSAMKAARSSSTQRAWQSLPRHLRRRAASHDVRRVPLRLRQKARAEMDPKKKSTKKSLPKLGKSRRIPRSEEFLKRQRDKQWLETHVWHAKRMRMENMWGYRLAATPTEKSFRPSHRASVHGSILHDASYQSLIELKGTQKALKALLDLCTDPQDPSSGSQRYTNGARILNTHIYKPNAYPLGLIAPVTLFWRPLPNPSHPVESTSTKKVEGNAKVVPEAPTNNGIKRTIWLQTHPSVFADVFSTLRTCATCILDKLQSASSTSLNQEEIELADLRGHVNVYEIMGPKSSQVLKGVLSPIGSETREDFKKFWAELNNLQSTGSLPKGMIVGFTVNDPRLKFPPKNSKPTNNQHPATVQILPSCELAESDIWQESIRESLKKPRYKKKDLDERRSKNLIPGTHLTVLRQDDRVPVLLIQRSLQAPEGESQSLHGWTLIIPSGWSMAFLASLVYTGTRVGGQRERQVQAFESGIPYFPRDYPSTSSYYDLTSKQAQEDKAYWDRKPPAKRANYSKLGTPSPFKADWDAVLSLRPHVSGEDLLSTQREITVENVDADVIQPWLLRGAKSEPFLQSHIFTEHNIIREFNTLRVRRGLAELDAKSIGRLIQGALVSVKVTMCMRGAPNDLALIYSVSDDEAKIWETLIQSHSLGTLDLVDGTSEQVQLAEVVPETSDIVGYVTSGNFSLSRGEGFAIGAISVLHFLNLQQQSSRLKLTSRLFVKIRDREGHLCRPAYLQFLSS